MLRLALILLLAAAATVAVAAWWVRPGSVARGLGRLEPDEEERLQVLLRAAAIPASQVRLVDTTGEPCTHERPSLLSRWFRLDRATRVHCVGVRAGRVESLALSGAALRELATVSELTSLRHVQLREGDLERVGRIPKGCRWETLDVSRNRLRQLDGIEACTRMTDLDVSQNRLRALPVESLRVLNALDASGNPLDDLTSLGGLDRLADLRLRDLPLTVASSVPPLAALERLELARTGIDTIDAETLERWPRLRWLGLAATPLAEVEGDYEVDRALKDPTLRLASGLRVGVRETPLGDRLAREAVAAHDGMARHSVEGLPRGSGRWQGARRKGRTRTGISSRLDVSGSAEWMTGARAISFDLDRALSATVTASVEAGRLRMYLAEGDGYVYAEAIPEGPLRIQGVLITGTDGFLVFAEAVGGRVEGLRWAVSGTS